MPLLSKIARIRIIAGDPRWLRFYWQRRFMDPVYRRRHAAQIAKRRPAAQHLALVDAAASQKLEHDGVGAARELLTPAQVAEVRAFLEQRLVQDEYRPETAPFAPLGDGRPEGCHVAFHSAEDVIAAPHLLALANRPDILAQAEAFLGARPLISYFHAWWSYPTNLAPQQAENFHRDVDDWRFLKLFVYLSDVGPDNGPHVYAKGSSDRAEMLQIRRYSDAEVIAAVGSDALVTATAPAGYGFLENTFGLHKGQPLREGRRLMFAVVYSLGELPYGPRRPVGQLTDAPAGCDAYVNRVYLK